MNQLAIIKNSPQNPALNRLIKAVQDGQHQYYQKPDQAFEFAHSDLEPVGQEFSSQAIPTIDISLAGQDFKPQYQACLDVHRFLDGLDIPAMAVADKGFWTYLTHSVFYDYTYRRFKLATDEEKRTNQILRYWFVKEQNFTNAVYGLYLIPELIQRCQDYDWFTQDELGYDWQTYLRFVCQDIPDYKMIFQHRLVSSPLLLFTVLKALKLVWEQDQVLGKYDIKEVMDCFTAILPTRNLQLFDNNPDRIARDILLKEIILNLDQHEYDHHQKEKMAQIVSSLRQSLSS